MMFQISQGYRKFMAFGFPAVNTVFINTQNQRARMVERLFQNLIELLMHNPFDGCFGDIKLPGNVFIAHAPQHLFGHLIVEPYGTDGMFLQTDAAAILHKGPVAVAAFISLRS
jgi:hypothetical protein